MAMISCIIARSWEPEAGSQIVCSQLTLALYLGAWLFTWGSSDFFPNSSALALVLSPALRLWLQATKIATSQPLVNCNKC